MQTVTAGEAARMLGVSRQTLYSYASRGLVTPVKGKDRRESRYPKDAIEELARNRRRGRRPKEIARTALDWGLPVLETSLTLIERERLYYRGRDALALASEASLEEVAGLLWQRDIRLAFPADPPASHAGAQGVGPADRAGLLTRFAVMADDDDTAQWQHDPARLSRGCGGLVRLLAAAMLGTSPSAAPLHLQCADAWNLGPEGADMVRQALVLCADHELNASGFTARCIASAGASVRAAVIGGLAALSGSRHGGTTARVEAFWRMVEGRRDTRDAFRDLLAGGTDLPGFGHPLYPSGDIRAAAILARTGPLLPEAARIAEAARELMGRPPSLDFALVAMRRALGLPEGAAFGIFALGRSVGWIAQALEQREQGTLIRPRAVYAGPRPADSGQSG